jgi:hypothetical protein
VVIVREENGVDLTEFGSGDRRTRQLHRPRAPAEVLLLARRVERRIGQEPPAAELDQYGRPPDAREPDVGHAGPGIPRAECSAAHERTKSATSSQPFCPGKWQRPGYSRARSQSVPGAASSGWPGSPTAGRCDLQYRWRAGGAAATGSGSRPSSPPSG